MLAEVVKLSQGREVSRVYYAPAINVDGHFILAPPMPSPLSRVTSFAFCPRDSLALFAYPEANLFLSLSR